MSERDTIVDTDIKEPSRDRYVILECHSPCPGEAVWNDDVGVYVCDTCGRVGDETCVGETHSNSLLFSGGQREDYIRFVGVITEWPSTYHVGPWIVVKSPYQAKDAIKSLDEQTTGRLWDSDMSCWLIKEHAKEQAIESLQEQGWGVIDFTDKNE